jgi:hypothetical protein
MSDYKFGDVVEFISSSAVPRGLTFRHGEDIVVLTKEGSGRYVCVGEARLSASNIGFVRKSSMRGPVKENLTESKSLFFKYVDTIGVDKSVRI